MTKTKDIQAGERTQEKAENCGYIVPPMIEARMTGVQYAKCFASGKVTLVYEDGETETATLTQKQIVDARDNFFSLVGSVQSYRPCIDVEPDDDELSKMKAELQKLHEDL